MSLSDQIKAVRCLTPVCARLTTHKAREPVPEHCPMCAGPVEPIELTKPRKLP